MPPNDLPKSNGRGLGEKSPSRAREGRPLAGEGALTSQLWLALRPPFAALDPPSGRVTTMDELRRGYLYSVTQALR